MSTHTGKDLGAPDHIHAGKDGKTRLGPEWLPTNGDLIPGYMLIGPETFTCGSTTKTVLVFQHRAFAEALREAGMMTGLDRHPACEFVLLPGRPQEPMRTNLSRRVFLTVQSGLFVADTREEALQQQARIERMQQAEVSRVEVNVPFGDIFPPTAPPPFRPGQQPMLVARTMLTRAVWQAREALPAIAPRNYSPLVPTTGMNWPQAEAWCAQFGMRLPTPDEWHFAARGNTSTRWPHGDDLDALTHYAWVLPSRDRSDDDAGRGIRLARSDRVMGLGPWEVALLRPNAYGLYDTLGNLCEMCRGERVLGRRSEHRARPYVSGAWYHYPEVLGEDNGSLFRVNDTEPPGSVDTGFRPVADIGMGAIRRLHDEGYGNLLYLEQGPPQLWL